MSLFDGRFKRVNIQKEGEEITLDEQQAQAVYTKSPKALVVAGAGSGKTRVLTERVKHLLAEGVEPSNIVAITFTNMASEELKSRLSNVSNIGDCFIGTIHSFANKVMKVSSDKPYTILNTEVSNGFYKELIDKYCKFLTFDRFLNYMDIKNSYDLGQATEEQMNNALNPSELAELMFIQGTSTPNLSELNKDDYPVTIRDLCDKYNVVDFNQLLTMATKYFEENNSEIEHLLIDEFQDIGNLEFNFFTSLNAQNVFYVGDDWQSIYGFKGGNVNIMLNLANSGEFDVLPITFNYRNSKEVLNLASKVINQVTNKIHKKILVPDTRAEGEVFIGNKNQLKDIVELAIAPEENLKDWFILVRTNKELLEVQDLLCDLKVRNTCFRREGLTLTDLNNLMNYNSVKVLTVHTSKGLEAKNVVLYGNFPVNVPKYRNNQEERKVMYVGVTRAKETLVVLN